MKQKKNKIEWNNRGPIKYLDDEKPNIVKSERTIYDEKTIAEEEPKKA